MTDTLDIQIQRSAFAQSRPKGSSSLLPEATQKVLSAAKSNIAALPNQLFSSTQIPVYSDSSRKTKSPTLNSASATGASKTSSSMPAM